ncbi:MAG: hypothetical protein EHM35_13590 [Planctomycetaceae bacterium]|nr:MAG: hypothetical protein EHM35_13590 [Planctomycetaceae bacterium]
MITTRPVSAKGSTRTCTTSGGRHSALGNQGRQTLRQAGQPDQNTDYLLDLSGNLFQILAEMSGTDSM